jgi:hypothetical protein
MKNLISTCLIFGLLSFNGVTQTSSIYEFEQNQCKALVSSGSNLLSSPIFGPSYFVPKGDNTSTIFLTNLWFGGIDQYDSLRVSATHFFENTDLFPGPFSNNNSYQAPLYEQLYINKIWHVTKEDIIYHIDNYAHPNYIVPSSITEWPGNGDTTLGVAWQLAPFIDINNDGIYNPMDGDYPCIKGDAATFTIYNDASSQHSTPNSHQMNIETHVMFYQFSSDNYLDSTSFLSLKIFNRGEHEYSDFRVAVNIDMDIGYPNDDFFGCDTLRNMGYTYNHSSFDPSGFGVNPPAMGLILLNEEMGNLGTFQNANVQAISWEAENFWNLMNSKWYDGEPWVIGGHGHPNSVGATTQTTNFLYPGNPLTQDGWSMYNLDGTGLNGSPMDDVRFFMTMPSKSFEPNDALNFEFALTLYMLENHLENTNGLMAYADSVQDYFNTYLLNYDCIQQGTGIQDSTLNNLVLYEVNNPYLEAFPNPATNQLTLKWSGLESSKIQLYSMDGRLAIEHGISLYQQTVLLDVSSLNDGIYIVRVGEITKKIVIRK